jgi:hypothetical protein
VEAEGVVVELAMEAVVVEEAVSCSPLLYRPAQIM